MKAMFKRIVAAAMIVMGLSAFFAPGVASAHAILDSSSPSSSEVLSTSPTQITLTFNEEIESKLGSIRLFNSEQSEIRIDKTQRSAADRHTAFASVPQLKKGVYIVVWRVVSADGHPVSGAFPFEIGSTSSGSAQKLLSNVLTGLQSTSDLRNPLAVARLLSFLGAIVLIGMVSITWGSSLARTHRAIGVFRFAAVVMGVGSLMVLFLQGPYAGGHSWGQIFNLDLIDDVLHTRLGVASLVRAAIALEWLLVTYVISREETALWKNIAVFTSFVSIASFAISGHPSAASNALVFVVVDAVHLTAIALWVGGVISLAILSGVEDLDDESRRFSRIATYAMPVAIVSGVAQSFHLLPSVASVGDTEYGRLLIAKTVLVLITVAIGTSARKKLNSGAAVDIKRHIRRESIIVLVVISLTSLMVGTSPTTSTTAATQSFSITMVQQDVVADFSVNPATKGTVEVHALFTPPGGNLHPVVAVKLVMSLPSRNIPNIPLNLIEIGPNHWSGVAEIPFAGEWNLQARVSPTANETLLYSTKFTVAG